MLDISTVVETLGGVGLLDLLAVVGADGASRLLPGLATAGPAGRPVPLNYTISLV